MASQSATTTMTCFLILGTIAVVIVPMAARADNQPPLPPPQSSSPSSSPSSSQASSNDQLSQKFRIDDSNPEASVPTDVEKNRNPLEFGYFLQDLLVRAEAARQNKDHAAVIRYHRAVAKAVPDQAKGWSKLCEAYEVVHDRERAIRACQYAVERPGVELGDYVRLVTLIIARPDDLSGDERRQVAGVLDHLAKEPAATLTLSHLRCQVGVKTKNIAQLEACTVALEKLAPDDAKTVIFRWSLALMKGQTQEAARLVERAKDLGVLADAVDRMQRLTFPEGTHRWHLWAVVGGCAGLMLGLLLLWASRRFRLTHA